MIYMKKNDIMSFNVPEIFMVRVNIINDFFKKNYIATP